LAAKNFVATNTTLNGNRGTQQEFFVSTKFYKKLYWFNRNSQLRSVL